MGTLPTLLPARLLRRNTALLALMVLSRRIRNRRVRWRGETHTSGRELPKGQGHLYLLLTTVIVRPLASEITSALVGELHFTGGSNHPLDGK